MAKYRKKPVVVEAEQWLKHGDHPEVGHYTTSNLSIPCKYCGCEMHNHGWIDTHDSGHTVCPGDWIITEADRVFPYPIKPDIFDVTYEPVEELHIDAPGSNVGPGTSSPHARLEVTGKTKVERIVAAVERLIEETPFPGSAKERELVSKAAREVEDILLQMPPNESVAVGESVDPDENKSWPYRDRGEDTPF